MQIAVAHIPVPMSPMYDVFVETLVMVSPSTDVSKLIS